MLRYPGYEAKSLGARIIAPHFDELRRVHNLASLEQLGRALGRAGT